MKVRNEEPNVPNGPMDHQEPSVKFTETTLRDAEVLGRTHSSR